MEIALAAAPINFKISPPSPDPRIDMIIVQAEDVLHALILRLARKFCPVLFLVLSLLNVVLHSPLSSTVHKAPGFLCGVREISPFVERAIPFATIDVHFFGHNFAHLAQVRFFICLQHFLFAEICELFNVVRLHQVLAVSWFLRAEKIRG
jgi:hypothetical protein